MKRSVKFLLLACLILLASIFVLTSCDIFDKDDNEIVYVDVFNIPEDGIYVGQFDEANIQLKVTYDDGTTETVHLKEADIPAEEAVLLGIPGTHTFEALYRGVEYSYTLTVKSPTCEITFVNLNDEVIKKSTYNFIDCTSEIVPPAAEEMVLPGYRFTGEWDKSLEGITEDTVIKGIYVKTYTVTFYNGINELISTQTVDAGEDALEPALEDRYVEGYVWKAWDRSFTDVQKDISVYGIYVKGYALLYRVDNSDHGYVTGSVESGSEVSAGNSITVIATAYANYVFDGWYLDGERISTESEYTFTMLSRGIELIAKFTVSCENNGHNFINGVCINCGQRKASEGLEYTLSSNGMFYILTGIGSCTDTDIVIPDTYENLPVKTIQRLAFSGCESLTSVVIGNNVTNIGDDAFRDCTNLASVVIGNNVTNIPNRAFAHCTSLMNITIPASVTSIGNWPFIGCDNLTSISVDINNSMYKDIDGNLYNKSGTRFIEYASGKTALSFTIPDGVTSIAKWAFAYCTCLRSVVIPVGVTSISDEMFYYCTNLTNITIPDSVTNIGSAAFFNCKSLSNIIIPNNVTSIDKMAFSGCSSLVNIEIPNRVTSIGDSMFANCTSLTSITIPNSVTNIGPSAFKYCDSLTSIKIPDSVTSIGDQAFMYCFGLTKVIIGDSVTSIGDEAFRYCKSLVSIVIGNSVTSIGKSAFGQCGEIYVVYNNSNLPFEIGKVMNDVYLAYNAKVLVNNGVITYADDGFEYILTEDGFLFRHIESQYSLIAYIGDEITVTLPRDINGNAYSTSSVRGFVNVLIPDNVTSVEDYMFSGCASLVSVNIPNTITSIGKAAFDGCSNLTSVVIPDSVTSIGEDAFEGCISLTSVTIPDSVTSIGSYAFEGCKSLSNVIFDGTIKQWDEISKKSYWNSNTGNYTVYCTDGTISKDGTVTYY